MQWLSVVAIGLLTGYAKADSPFGLAERGSSAWSISWMIAGVLVGGTLLAGVVKLRIELAKKRRAGWVAPPRAAPRASPAGLVWIVVGVTIFTGTILTMFGVFMSRPLSAGELQAGGGLMVFGAVLMVVALRSITRPREVDPRDE